MLVPSGGIDVLRHSSLDQGTTLVVGYVGFMAPVHTFLLHHCKLGMLTYACVCVQGMCSVHRTVTDRNSKQANFLTLTLKTNRAIILLPHYLSHPLTPATMTLLKRPYRVLIVVDPHVISDLEVPMPRLLVLT